LLEKATVKESLTVQIEGARRVKRSTFLYNLHLILAVGYRVRSPRGTEFRQWATRHLAEFLVKGFLMDDERLKNPGGWDYFDELLERIREIRTSEKRFYQKVRDLFSLSTDYHDNENAARVFFSQVQNKLLYAVTQRTAAEIVVDRAAANSPNMALMSWSGSRVRKQDVIVAKNYLTADEVDSLNRLVVIFLEQAELRVKERKQLTLDYPWSSYGRILGIRSCPEWLDRKSVLKGWRKVWPKRECAAPEPGLLASWHSLEQMVVTVRKAYTSRQMIRMIRRSENASNRYRKSRQSRPIQSNQRTYTFQSGRSELCQRNRAWQNRQTLQADAWRTIPALHSRRDLYSALIYDYFRVNASSGNHPCCRATSGVRPASSAVGARSISM
jgi:hypothetical protein